MHNPSEIVEPVKILSIENRPFALAEVNPAIRVAVTEQAKDEQRTGENKVEPVWNFDLNSCHFLTLSSDDRGQMTEDG
jgi:hypothetical protein